MKCENVIQNLFIYNGNDSFKFNLFRILGIMSILKNIE